jgi:hypothetical protein
VTVPESLLIALSEGEAAVANWGKDGLLPTVSSISADTHLFHGYSGDDLVNGWKNATFLLLNKNGNFLRLVKSDGNWHGFKFWSSGTNQLKALTSHYVDNLLHLVSAGSTRGERLTYLPGTIKHNGKRVVVWRNRMLTCRILSGGVGFELTPINYELDGVSEKFEDKPWMSALAVEWCARIYADCAAVDYDTAQIIEAAMIDFGGMEDSPHWGIF